MRTLLLILLSCTLGFSQTGLVNYYNFTEKTGTTLTDRKGSANGTTAGVTTPTFNTANWYMSFSGGHGVTTGSWGRVGYATRTTFDKTYTNNFCFTVYFRSSKSDANNHYLISNYASVANGSINIYIDASENISFYGRDANGNLKTGSGGAVCDGKWHSVYCSYTGNVVSMSLDGRPYITMSTNNAYNGTFYGAASKQNLGAAFDTGNLYFGDLTGDIAEFGNYNRVLSIGEQATDYTNKMQGIW